MSDLTFLDRQIFPSHRRDEWSGKFVRLETGEIGRIVRGHPDSISYFIVQMDPYGKGRHRDRRSVHHRELEILNPLEALAEAAW